MYDLRDTFETTDGSRPNASALNEATARHFPLDALAILRTGDAFEGKKRAPADDFTNAFAYIKSHIKINRPFSLKARVPKAHEERVKSDIVKQLSQNPRLLERMKKARGITIDLVSHKKSIADFGYPSQISKHAAGLFWDHPSWPRARIALREQYLEQDDTLVFHEMAHAIHYLAFTKKERAIIYDHLRAAFGSRAAMDEVFAIYTEREFGEAFDDKAKAAPGIYGFTRQEWDENHVFSRFIAKLYRAHVVVDKTKSKHKATKLTLVLRFLRQQIAPQFFQRRVAAAS